MSDFELKHLKAALRAAGTQVQQPNGDPADAISKAMDACGVPASDENIVSELTAALADFGHEIRRAERDCVPIPLPTRT